MVEDIHNRVIKPVDDKLTKSRIDSMFHTNVIRTVLRLNLSHHPARSLFFFLDAVTGIGWTIDTLTIEWSIANRESDLRNGADLVMGNRFKGGIAPGAMPFLHRYLGNPVLSWTDRLFFHLKVGDFHCGLRGFNRERLIALNLRTTGMEFASEMVVRAALATFVLKKSRSRSARMAGRGRRICARGRTAGGI